MSALKGRAELMKNLFNFAKKYPEHVGHALLAETEIEAEEVRARTPVYVGPEGPGTPIPGLLKDSIQARGPFYEGNEIRCSITAGGNGSEAYALRQHEELDWFHEVGEAKYIESVIMESRSHILVRVANRIDFSKVRY